MGLEILRNCRNGNILKWLNVQCLEEQNQLTNATSAAGSNIVSFQVRHLSSKLIVGILNFINYCIDLKNSRAIFSDNNGGTALPIWRYLFVTEPRKTKSSGKPCERAISRMVMTRC